MIMLEVLWDPRCIQVGIINFCKQFSWFSRPRSLKSASLFCVCLQKVFFLADNAQGIHMKGIKEKRISYYVFAVSSVVRASVDI